MGLARYYAGQVIRGYFPAGLARQIGRTRRSFANWRSRRKEQLRLRRYGKLTPTELAQALRQVGVRSGGVLLVHSSFGEFVNFEGTANDLLKVLNELVGPQGTLMMPAQYVSPKNQFNVGRHPASVGLLCELFRRQEGTLRSAHPGQSVCARGPLAKTLIESHHQYPLGCGPQSPFAKLLDFEGQILGLGLPPLWTTFLHVVEDLAPEQFPWQMYDGQSRTFQVIDAEGQQFEMTIPLRDSKILARIDPRSLSQKISGPCQTNFDVKGIPCFLADCVPLYAELKTLAAAGYTAYGAIRRKSA